MAEKQASVHQENREWDGLPVFFEFIDTMLEIEPASNSLPLYLSFARKHYIVSR